MRPASARVPRAGLTLSRGRYTTVKRSGRRGLISTSSLGTATRCPRISTTVRVAPVLTTGYHAPCRSIGSLTKGGAATHTRAQPTGWIIVSTGWIIVIGMAPRWPAVLWSNLQARLRDLEHLIVVARSVGHLDGDLLARLRALNLRVIHLHGGDLLGELRGVAVEPHAVAHGELAVGQSHDRDARPLEIVDHSSDQLLGHGASSPTNVRTVVSAAREGARARGPESHGSWS